MEEAPRLLRGRIPRPVEGFVDEAIGNELPYTAVDVAEWELEYAVEQDHRPESGKGSRGSHTGTEVVAGYIQELLWAVGRTSEVSAFVARSLRRMTPEARAAAAVLLQEKVRQLNELIEVAAS
jgi:hypothetical protein